MKIFVTGATGVVGRRAVPLLVAAGHDVTAAGRNPRTRATLERAGARVVAADLFEPASLRKHVAGHDVVVNLATHMPSSSMRMMLPGAFRENDRVRREGSSNLADAVLAGDVGRFVQESFAPVYADAGARWIDEDFPQRPVKYNMTVLDAERSAHRVAERGRDAIVLRFAGMYGPDGRFFHDMAKMMKRGMAPLPGAPSAFVSSISHDDAATAVLAAVTMQPGTYNVCDDEPLTRQAYFAALAAALGTAPPKPMPHWMTALMGSLGDLLSRSERMSNRKLRAQGWAPRLASVRTGFAEAVRALAAAA